jgi:hypothetical protein
MQQNVTRPNQKAPTVPRPKKYSGTNGGPQQLADGIAIMNSLSTTMRAVFRPSATPKFFKIAATQQIRNASILGSLSDTPGAYNKRIRRGRGPASGKGKTSGRGHKGQKQHGKVPAHFNGGQTTDEVVHGVRGFKNMYAHPGMVEWAEFRECVKAAEEGDQFCLRHLRRRKGNLWLIYVNL